MDKLILFLLFLFCIEFSSAQNPDNNNHLIKYIQRGSSEIVADITFPSFKTPVTTDIPGKFNPDSKEYNIFKTTADSIFSANQLLDSFYFQHVYYNSDMDNPKIGVLIGHLFNNLEKTAIVMYSTSDTTSDLTLYRQQNLKWNLMQRQSIGSGSISPSDRFIFFDNLNDDNTKELLILTNVWLTRSGENLKAFFYKKNKLTEIRGFEDYPNPVYDKKTKKIFSYMGTGCADMTMRFMEGVIQNDTLITKNDIGCDCCSDAENPDSCTIYINDKNPFRVLYEDSYKYVLPFYQDFVKCKLQEVKGN